MLVIENAGVLQGYKRNFLQYHLLEMLMKGRVGRDGIILGKIFFTNCVLLVRNENLWNNIVKHFNIFKNM